MSEAADVTEPPESGDTPTSDSPDSTLEPGGGAKQSKSKPAKILPTDRLSFEKQLGGLRGYAVAGGAERRAVSNNEVASIVGIHVGTISNCNPFFADVQLIERDGVKYRPSEAVVAYANSYEWDQATAAAKLAPVLEKTWFAEALLPRLAFRPLSRDEALTVLADAAKASKDYKFQLELVLDYLRVAGLIIVDGNTVTGVPKSRRGAEAAPAEEAARSGAAPAKPAEPSMDTLRNVERFEIPIPGKPSAQITIPKDLSAEDWAMLQTMLAAYVSRLQAKQQPRNSSTEGQPTAGS